MKKEDLKNHLNRVREDLVSELSNIRTGRATQALVDGIMVMAYEGSPAMPLNELATVSVPDSQSVVVTPWDKSILAKIEDAILKSNRGLNPVNDGGAIRVPVPMMTEEARRQRVKDVSKKVEDSKIKVRMLRQDSIKSLDEMENNGVISEDDMHRQKEEIEKLIKESNLALETLGEHKEKELMQI